MEDILKDKDIMMMDMIAAVAILAKVKPEDVVRVMHKEKDKMQEFRKKMVTTSIKMLESIIVAEMKVKKVNKKK